MMYESSSTTLTSSPSFGQPSTLHPSAEPHEAAIADDYFEFSSLIPVDSETHPLITADDIFSGGRIRPIYYPVPSAAFRDKPKRPQLLQLLMEEHDSEASYSSFADELEGIPKETYCLWPPEHSQGSLRKCCSAGSFFGWFWVRDLVLRRSNGGFEEWRSTEKKAERGRKGI